MRLRTVNGLQRGHTCVLFMRSDSSEHASSQMLTHTHELEGNTCATPLPPCGLRRRDGVVRLCLMPA